MNYQREIYEVMKDLGVKPNTLGYKYCSYIVSEYLAGNFDVCEKLMAVYTKTAEKFNSTWSRVERAIRYSIETICYETDVEVLNKYFGNCLRIRSGKVDNGTFLACIVEYMRVYVING